MGFAAISWSVAALLLFAFEAQNPPMRSGEEIQGGLRKFAARWRDYSGTERGATQAFLDELIECCGADRKAVGARFKDAHTATGIMDLFWPVRSAVMVPGPHPMPAPFEG